MRHHPRHTTRLPPYSIEPEPTPLLAVALHAGHRVRAEVADALCIDVDTRLREEDACTAAWTGITDQRIVVHTSRFEVDLNRPRALAVYSTPATAWGLDVWGGRPVESIRTRSLRIYDRFYADLARIIEGIVAREGGALVYDLHSYNHRRAGPRAAPAPQALNPDVNVGTGALDRDRWGGVVEAFIDSLRGQRVRGHPIDARENVRFLGGHMSEWVSRNFSTACVLAIDVKKTFMDEWTHETDDVAVRGVRDALAATIPPALRAFRRTLEGRSAA